MNYGQSLIRQPEVIRNFSLFSDNIFYKNKLNFTTIITTYLKKIIKPGSFEVNSITLTFVPKDIVFKLFSYLKHKVYIQC